VRIGVVSDTHSFAGLELGGHNTVGVLALESLEVEWLRS
jgi:hypothetical protein